MKRRTGKLSAIGDYGLRVTIPADLGRDLGLKSGDAVMWVFEEGTRHLTIEFADTARMSEPMAAIEQALQMDGAKVEVLDGPHDSMDVTLRTGERVRVLITHEVER